MYIITSRQQNDGSFTTFDTTDTFDEAIDSAKCQVDGQPNEYSVYVFNKIVATELQQKYHAPRLVAIVSSDNGSPTVA